MAEHLLEVRNLSVEFHTAAGIVPAVRNISYHLDRGETLAILGESGSGKSVSSSAIMNLIDMPPGRISSGQILLDGQDLLTMPAHARREANGRRIAMIFQDPLSHLNPVYTVGWQIREAMTTHGMQAGPARSEAVRLLTRVGIPDPEGAMGKYPHEFSGGQRQRVMIAMALALRPDLLIADEPTTALDVTVQAEVLALLKELQRETGMGVLIITHDLGVVAEIADRVVVMEKGEPGRDRHGARGLQEPDPSLHQEADRRRPWKRRDAHRAADGRTAAQRPGCPQALRLLRSAEGRVFRPQGRRNHGDRRGERLGQIDARPRSSEAGRARCRHCALEGA
uniref:ABC transporter ATP-binding protein n=1 Tax=Neorhizobium sp. EC2-8 TaxID=3129230 RepID=UPI003100F889